MSYYFDKLLRELVFYVPENCAWRLSYNLFSIGMCTGAFFGLLLLSALRLSRELLAMSLVKSASSSSALLCGDLYFPLPTVESLSIEFVFGVICFLKEPPNNLLWLSYCSNKSASLWRSWFIILISSSFFSCMHLSKPRVVLAVPDTKISMISKFSLLREDTPSFSKIQAIPSCKTFWVLCLWKNSWFCCYWLSFSFSEFSVSLPSFSDLSCSAFCLAALCF